MEAFSGLFFLMVGLLMLSIRRIKTSITLMAVQASALSLIAFTKGINLSGELHLIAIGFLTFAIKVVILPFILSNLINKLKIENEMSMYPGSVFALCVGVLIVGLTYGYVVPVILEDIKVGQNLLASAIATILFGCFYVISRRCVISQVIGIVIMENGLFLSALAITGGMPLIIELGIFFDILIGVLVMGAIVFRISHRFESLDIKVLRKLRG